MLGSNAHGFNFSAIGQDAACLVTLGSAPQ
jgi:hypothetical protein